MIVKHRRGTTQEWFDVDLIPEEGELVIEECQDGTLKCKIGTGTAKFSELPYLDDKTKAILLQEITAVKAYSDNKIAELGNSLSSNIDDVAVKLTEEITTKALDLANDFTNRDTILDNKFAGELDSAAQAIRAELADAVQLLTNNANNAHAKFNSDLVALETNLTAALTSVSAALEEATAAEELSRINADNAIAEELAAHKISYADDLIELTKADADSIAAINTLTASHNSKVAALEAADAALLQAISAAEDSFDDKLAEAAEGLTGAIESLERRIIGDTGESGTSNEPSLSKLQKQFDGLKASVTGDIDVINGELQELKDTTANELDIEIEGSFANTIQTNIDSNTNAIADLRASTTIALTGVESSMDAIYSSIADTDDKVTESFNELTDAIEAAKTEVKAAVDEIGLQVEQVNEDIEATNLSIDVQKGRIDSLLAMPEGSTMLDSEVIDIRIGHDGTPYGSAGSAVRSIGERLSEYIGTEAVNGLVYDYTGEVGIKQPYMLYLTANDQILEPGVQIISGAGGGPGGGGSNSSLTIKYITTSPIKVTTNDEVILKYAFSGTDSSGDKIYQASAEWKVNGTTVEYGVANDGENNEFNVTKYLTPGTTKVLLAVTDDNGSVATKKWEITQYELLISSTFDDKVAYPAGTNIPFTYTPTGALEKTVIFKLDGHEIASKSLAVGISGIEDEQEISAQEHGSHLLEVIIEASVDNIPLPPVSLKKNLIWYDPDNNKTPIISSVDSYIETKQYSTNNIIYTVYDPNADIPTVYVEIDGELVATQQITPNKDYNNTPTAVYPYVATSVGTHVIKLICGTAEPKEIIVDVKKLDIDISPVTAGLVFDFNPTGKTNDVNQRTWSYNGISMSVSDNFDWTNGGYLQNDPDGPCFCIKAGSSATINYELFGDDAKTFGKEFKLVFKTKNVSNPDAVVLSCLDNTTDKDYVGLQMGVHGANIYGQSGNLELAYSEEDLVEFEFNISKYTSGAGALNMIMGYEDGVPSRPLVYDSSYNFKQHSPKEITIGSPDCDLYIYRFKVYNKALSASDILSNFIADARTPDEMIARYNRNQIYDENHKLTPEKLAENCPWLRVYKVSAPHFTNNKSNKVERTTIQQIYKNGDPVLDNWTCYNAKHSGQGTSSNNYGAAGRNLDFIMDGDTTYFELGDGTIAREITLTRESVPVAYLNAKVNIASSNNLTNAILANRYNRFNPYNRPFVRPEGYPVNNIKDTMEFHNCVIFIQETDPKLSTHREFADTDWHFYAIGNIGDSKKTDKTRATDQDDKYECCVEIMDVKLPLSDFPVDTMMNAMGYTIDEDTKEKIYTWAKDENLDILYEREYTLTGDDEVNLNKTYYIDLPVKVVASSEHLTVENLENLYDRLYVFTEDVNVKEEKVYYLDDIGTLATKEYLHTIINPSAEGLYEWRREYKKTSDTEIIQDKAYYIEVLEKTNAMAYTFENVRNYLLAKDENLNILYEYIDGEYLKTADTSIDLSKTYYTKSEEKDQDGNIIATSYTDAMGYVIEQVKSYTYAKNENLDRLYEVTYFKTADSTVDLSGNKTYFVDILEHDDFSEDYTYGWRYISDKKDTDVVSYCKQKWIEFYRFVTTSTDEEFKRDFENYFVKESALYYYLFTTRYCMVDNRAKNTFWHYGKTEELDADGNPIRKWDLCWDYDNDTSLGLNNYGKQVYRYGLEDVDVDVTGEEVFREMDSTFFCRVRDLFSSELKEMYNDLESQNAWHADSFIEECDTWQDEFPEELWRIDIDRKYIRTYTSSFINGKGDNQFLVNMCNGKMKYHRRQWERNQAQYMASKYQTTTASGDNYHANFRFGGPTSSSSANAVPADYQLTLTPYSYMYLNVQYGETSPSTVRVTDTNINTPITVPFYGNSADIVNVYSASSIRDFGDLSKGYPKTVSIGNASRVKKLTLGNATEGYNNTVFTTLTTDANPLLEELDVTNISSLQQTLDLSKLINLRSVKAFGTSVQSMLFAEGGKLDYVEIPALTSLKLNKLTYLSSANLKMSSFDYVTDLVVEDCPLIDKLELLNKCTNLNRVRLTNVDFGTVDYDYFVNKLFDLKGLSPTGAETANAYISGTCYIASLTGAQYEELTTRYKDLVIKFGTLTSEVVFKYSSADGEYEHILHTEPVVSSNSEFSACQDPGLISQVWPANDAFTYEQVGWSTIKQISNGVADTEDDYKQYLQEDALLNISSNRTVYPVFKAIRRSYEVKFINPTVRQGDSGYLLKTFAIPYGSNVNYYAPYTNLDEYIAAGQPVPEKMNSSDPSLYAFIGWYPDSTLILGEAVYEAQFAFIDDKWYELNRNELYKPKYDNQNETMTFDAYMNTSNIAVKVPDTILSNEGVNCKVVGLGFYNDESGSDNDYIHTNLEFVKLPNYLTEIFASGFQNCSRLTELTLPESLQTIGKSAFQGCSKLKAIHIPANVITIRDAAFGDCSGLMSFSVDDANTIFTVDEDCLVDTVQQKLLRGTTGKIPADFSIKYLGEHCFSSTGITSVSIPDGTTKIGGNAFSRCYSLSEVTLPSTLVELGSTCFSWCKSLSSIVLPDNLTELPVYAFNECALSEVEIPAAVGMIRARALGGMQSLNTVTFKVNRNNDGSIKLPQIHVEAFKESGTAYSHVHFYVPWSRAQHEAAYEGVDKNNNPLDPFFGATGVTYEDFTFDYIAEEIN